MSAYEVPHQLDRPVRFAEFVFDPRAGEVSSESGVVRLGEKPAAALEVLLATSGAVVDRQTFCRHLWPDGTVVDFDNNLNAAIKKLRDALGDNAEAPRFIETLPRRGYRFIGEIEATKPAASSASPEPTNRPRRHFTWALRALVLASVAALLVVAALRLRSVTAAPSALPMLTQARLVVLPFATIGESPPGDTSPSDTSPPEWLRDGLTEELITLLGRLEPLRLGVIARHSSMQYRDREASLSEIGRALDVEWAIEGTVAAVAARTRVSVRLVRIDDETVVWADRYEERRGAAEALVRRVAAGVGTALADQLVAGDPAARLRGGSLSSEAYEAFLVGRAAWHRFEVDGHLEARAAFERALETDPEFAPAHAALADVYNLLAFTDIMSRAEAFAAAEAAARQALARDPNLALAHNALGFARLYGRWDIGGALSHFARAVALDPNYAMAHHWRAGALVVAGRAEDAVAAARRALELDPLSLSVISDLGWYLIYADRFDEAATLCRQTLEANPDYRWASSCLIEASRSNGDLETVIERLRQHRQATSAERAARPAIDAPDLRLAIAALDRLGLDRLLEESEPHALSVAEAYARLGDLDSAFSWLERAFVAADPWLLFLPVQPFFDALHGDPRLADLAARIGLPAEVRRTLSSASASG